MEQIVDQVSVVMKWEVIVSLSGCFDELLGKTKQMEDYKIIIIIIIFTASGDSTAHVWKTTVNMIGKQVNTHTHTHTLIMRLLCMHPLTACTTSK